RVARDTDPDRAGAGGERRGQPRACGEDEGQRPGPEPRREPAGRRGHGGDRLRHREVLHEDEDRLPVRTSAHGDEARDRRGRARVGTGTPITGSVVCAATTPARCAAPPAPAISTAIPRRRAVCAYCITVFGERCADITCASKSISNAFRRSAAPSMVSQSLS